MTNFVNNYNDEHLQCTAPWCEFLNFKGNQTKYMNWPENKKISADIFVCVHASCGGSINTLQRKHFFGDRMYKFEFLKAQPCWFTLFSVESKNGLAPEVLVAFVTHWSLVYDVTNAVS